MNKNWLFSSQFKIVRISQVIYLHASKQLEKPNYVHLPAFFKYVSAQVPIHQVVHELTTLKSAISPVLKWIQDFQEQTKELPCCLVRNLRKS